MSGWTGRIRKARSRDQPPAHHLTSQSHAESMIAVTSLVYDLFVFLIEWAVRAEQFWPATPDRPLYTRDKFPKCRNLRGSTTHVHLGPDTHAHEHTTRHTEMHMHTLLTCSQVLPMLSYLAQVAPPDEILAAASQWILDAGYVLFIQPVIHSYHSASVISRNCHTCIWLMELQQVYVSQLFSNWLSRLKV